jgi:thioredoxin-related protein
MAERGYFTFGLQCVRLILSKLIPTPMKTKLASLLATFALATFAHAAVPAGWTDDLTKAQAQAKTEKKLVLLDFTGSDWCGWCMKLDKDVFSKSEFKTYAKENLILVEVDFPNQKPQTKKVKDQNAALKKQYNVGGFPTIVILNGSGKEVARWGGYSEHFFDELKEKVSAAKSK